MNKTNTVLALLLIGQIVAILVLTSPFGGADTPSVDRGPLIDAEADRVLSIAITDADGGSIEIAKRGGAWVVASADGYPADETAVPVTIERILGMKTGRPVTRQAKNHKQLEVSDSKFQRKIRLAGDGDKEIATVYLGESPNYNQQNVRRSGSDVVYLVSGVAPADFSTSASRWVDSRWFAIDEGDITSFELEKGDETVSAVRGEDGAWRLTQPSEDVLAVADVDPVLRGWKNVYLTEPVGKDDGSYGFDAPTAIVDLRVTTTPAPAPESSDESDEEGGAADASDAPEPVVTSHRIVIGAAAGDGYYAKHDGSDFVVLLSTSSVEQKFLNATDDLVPTVEEPVDAPAAESPSDVDGDAASSGESDPEGSDPDEGGF